MVKKIFVFFLGASILTLIVLCGYYYLSTNRESIQEIPILGDAFPMEDVLENIGTMSGNGQLEEIDDTQNLEKPTYKGDVMSVHVCDGYSDGSFSIRNIRMDMTFRQVVNTELKNIGVYVSDNEYGRDTFYCMSSNDNQGKDLLPVLERAILGYACEIIYNFSADITIEDPEEYPYLEGVQYQFIQGYENVDPEKKIESAFTTSFGKPTTKTENEYYMSLFTAPKETITMYYEYKEEDSDYNLRYILWEKIE